MQDDATWKQAGVIVDLARQVAGRDKTFAEVYGFGSHCVAC
jgi:malyl-CoA/(S)-citramalyl-CoA lyase